LGTKDLGQFQVSGSESKCGIEPLPQRLKALHAAAKSGEDQSLAGIDESPSASLGAGCPPIKAGWRDVKERAKAKESAWADSSFSCCNYFIIFHGKTVQGEVVWNQGFKWFRGLTQKKGAPPAVVPSSLTCCVYRTLP